MGDVLRDGIQVDQDVSLAPVHQAVMRFRAGWEVSKRLLLLQDGRGVWKGVGLGYQAVSQVCLGEIDRDPPGWDVQRLSLDEFPERLGDRGVSQDAGQSHSEVARLAGWEGSKGAGSVRAADWEPGSSPPVAVGGSLGEPWDVMVEQDVELGGHNRTRIFVDSVPDGLVLDGLQGGSYSFLHLRPFHRPHPLVHLRPHLVHPHAHPQSHRADKALLPPKPGTESKGIS